MIRVENIKKTFNPHSSARNQVLKGVSFDLPDKNSPQTFISTQPSIMPQTADTTQRIKATERQRLRASTQKLLIPQATDLK